MKQLMTNSKLMLIALMVTLTLTSVKSLATAKGETPVEFKYLGTTDNQPLFLLNLNNSESREVEVTLRDHNGQTLYTEKVSGIQISRRYRLNTDEIDNSKITVEVFDKTNNTKVVYDVKRTSRVVEDVTINKL